MINLITVLSIEGTGTPGREMGLCSVTIALFQVCWTI